MLYLTRRIGEKVHVGDMVVEVVMVRGKEVRLAFTGPREIPVWRHEILPGQHEVTPTVEDKM